MANKVSGTSYAYSSNANKNLNTYRASGLVGENGDNLAITTTNISVFSNDMKIGFVQSMNPQEQRNITKIQELGTEGVVQSVAGNTNGGSLSASKFAVYNSNLFNAFGLTNTGKFMKPVDVTSDVRKDSVYGTYSNPFKTLKDQRVPLEICVKISVPGTDNTYITETYIDCWLASYGKSIAANTITISETATIQYSDVI